MDKIMKRVVSWVLVFGLLLSQSQPIIAEALEEQAARIVSAEMGTDAGGVSNLEGYHSNEDWTKAYPDGLFLVEYSSYEVREGGTDPDNPEDVYLGIVVYRIGGNSVGATVEYSLACLQGDEEIYPNSVGTVWFAPQQSTAIIKIRIPNDDIRNGDQALLLSLDRASTGVISSANVAAIGVSDDEPYVQSEVSMVLSEAVTDKSAGGIKVVVKRINHDVDLCTLKISTSDGTAIAGKDYETVEQEVVFVKGQTEQIVTIPLIQSEDVYTEAKHLTVTLSDMKGCKAVSGETLRVSITNRCDEGTKKPVSVDGLKPDVEVDDGGALTDQAGSIVNVNDDIDRLALLRTVIGTADGTAVQSMSCGTLLATSEAGYWEPTVVIPNSGFTQKYSTGDPWDPTQTYTDGNGNLMLVSAATYDLNRFYAVEPHFSNQRNPDLILSFPNTAFGYLMAGNVFDQGKFPSFIKHDYLDGSDKDRKHMEDYQIYYLENWNYEDVNTIQTPIAYPLMDTTTGKNYPNTVGQDGERQKLFYMLYDDEEWDDHNFTLADTILYRAVIPFSQFDATSIDEGITSFQAVVNEEKPNESYIQFEKDGFLWRIRVDDSRGGGAGQVPSMPGGTVAERYGFFVGSNLKVEYKPIGGSAANMPVPQYFYLVDADGGVHHAAVRADGFEMSSDGFLTACSIPMETLLTNVNDTLAASYHMTKDQIDSHNALVKAGETIHRGFGKILTFQVALTQQPPVVIHYGSIPTLTTKTLTVTGKMETDAQQQERIYGILKDVVTFYDADDTKLQVAYQVDLKNQRLVYEQTSFSYLTVAPEMAGGGTRIKSNLYDQELVDFGGTKQISVEDCAQMGGGVKFDIYNENLTYLPPHITIDQVAVSSRDGGSFVTEYIADSLAKHLNFEVLHHDTAAAPKLSYYTVRFTISDIYASGANRQVKEYPVTIWYERTNGTERWELLSFVFKGGASLTEARDTQMQILCSTYLDVAESKVAGVDAEGYQPVLTLLDYNSNGYQYELHIPTYYDYQAKDSLLMQTYTQRFMGADGISIVLDDYDKGDGAAQNNAISTVDVTDMPYVATYIPPVAVQTHGAELTSHYCEEQRNFYTYTDYTTGWSIANITADTAPILMNISRMMSMAGKDDSALANIVNTLYGSGVYANYTGNQFCVGLRLVVCDAPDLEPDKTANFQNAFLADHALSATGVSNTAGRWNVGSYLTYSATFDIQFTHDYNELTHEWHFSQFMFMGSGGFCLSKNIPIPALLNLVYASLSFTASYDVSMGSNHVLDYVDQDGTSHFKVNFAGAYVDPLISVSAGVGVGMAGLASLAVGITATFSAHCVLVNEQGGSPQREFDIDSVKGATADKYSIEFSDGWKTYTPAGTSATAYSFGQTLCESNTKGDTIVIQTTGTSFQLVGMAGEDGGEMEITVTDQLGNTQTTTCSTHSSRNELYKLLYHWGRSENFADQANVAYTVTITNTNGGRISLDSFRVYNRDFEETASEKESFDSFSFNISMYAELSLLFFSISIEPGWMLLEANEEGGSFTLGTIGLSKSWDWSWPWKSIDNQDLDDAPLLLATRSKTASTTKPGYFDTGAYSDLRTQSLLHSDISNTAKTQVLSHNGHTYTFYTVLDKTDQGDSFYQLYCTVDGGQGMLVSGDVFVADFEAFIDGTGDLSLAMTCSDSTVTSVTIGADGKAVMTTTDGTQYPVSTAKELRQALIRTRVKLVTLVLGADGAVIDSVSKVLGATDSGDSLQDSNPVGVDIPGGSCVFYNTATSSLPSGATSDWESFIKGETDLVNDLLSSLYQGNSELYCTVVTGSGVAVTTQIPLSQSLTDRKDAIITVTSMDAVSHGNTISLAYTVEVSNAELGGHKGVLKQIHYRQITVGTDGSIVASETVVVDSVFDYDERLSDVLGVDPKKYPAKYYNAKRGETYESNILRNVQLERAVIGENGTAVSDDAMVPCLFYQTNAGIHYITYDTLQRILDGTDTEQDKVGVLYDGSLDDYVIAVSAQGAISLIYNDVSKTSAYTDTLYIIDYCPDYQVWNKARQLTYTDVFDDAAFKNHQPTGSLAFDDLSAFIDGDGNVTIALKSTYAPFSYEYGAIVDSVVTGDKLQLKDHYDAVVENENGEFIPYMVTPIQDYASEAARTDVYMITFQDRMADAKVTGLRLDNELFVPGQQIGAQIQIENSGDYMLTDLKVSLYHRTPDSSKATIVATQQLSMEFFSGDTITTDLSYTVGSTFIPDGTVLGVLITDGTGRITFYDSYEDCYVPDHDEDPSNDQEPTYRLIENAAEYYFRSTRVDIDASGMMSYSVCLGNGGNVDAQEDVTVYLRLYSYDPETNQSRPTQTLFGFRVGAEALAAGVYTTVSDTYDVRNYLKDGNLYYAFEIVAEDAQFSTLNDQQQMQTARQIPEIVIDGLYQESGHSIFSDGRVIHDLTLGQELELDTGVLAQFFDASSLRFYEIGTNCLSIDASSQNGKARVKVVDLPNGQEGYVKLLISVDGTVINKYLYLHVTDRETIDLKEENGDGTWTLSPPYHAYAIGFDWLSTRTNGSILCFDFYGGDFRLYGDRLTDGGSFILTIRDAKGVEMVRRTVSTKAELDDYGVMLTECHDLPYGHYFVTVEAVLAEGERLVLDHARHLIDTSDADTTPYTVVQRTQEILDAPLLSGRDREATFKLVFSDSVALAKGARIEDITVDFAEFELVDGKLTATGETVSFTASHIDGKELVMRAKLASTPGAVRVYGLADGGIPRGCLVSGGKPVDTKIPNYHTVTYVLKESGIMSVVVADDSNMPSGSIRKSVQVKFMAAPAVSRLEGTKLLYVTADSDGTQRTVEFHYAGLTEDPRVAVYRADELTLQRDELTKLFRYQEGIVLNRDNYVLVTRDGDYLENDITTVISDSSLLDIAYTKLQAEQARLSFGDGMMKVTVDYPEPVSAVGVDASVQVKRIVKDAVSGSSTETLLTLPLIREDGARRSLVFAAAEQETFPAGMTVIYQLNSKAITYGNEDQSIVRSYDGIAVDPTLPQAADLVFGTDAWIIDASPFVDGQGTIGAEVTFSTVMDVDTLMHTSLELDIQVTEYTGTKAQVTSLSFRSARTVAGRTVAVYGSDRTAKLEHRQTGVTYLAPATLKVPAGEALRTAGGNDCSSTILDPGVLTIARPQAQSAQISLRKGQDYGHDVVMTVQFDTALSALTMTSSYAYVDMVSGGDTQRLCLGLESVEGNALTFATTTPVVLPGDVIITFKALERFADPDSVIRDGAGLGVSEILPDTTLVYSTEAFGGIAWAQLQVDEARGSQVTVSFRAAFDTNLARQSFNGSSVVIAGNLTYADGTTSRLEKTVGFSNVENGNVAVFTTTVELPADVDTAVLRVASAQIHSVSPLYSADHTVKLSGILPQVTELSVGKAKATDISVELQEGTAAIDVTFAEPITAENLENITLTANVSGRSVVFTGYAVSGNVLRLRAQGITAPATIRVAAAKLTLSGQAALYASASGLAVSLAVPDLEVSFPDGSGGAEVIPPTGDSLQTYMALLLLLAMAAVVILVRKWLFTMDANQ